MPRFGWAKVFAAGCLVTGSVVAGGVNGPAGAAPAAAIIENFAGGGACDGRVATSVPFAAVDIAGRPDGSVVFVEPGTNRVRRIEPSSFRILDTIAGNGVNDSTGDGGPADQAALKTPTAVAVAANGDVYIAEAGRIRKVTAATGRISTIAGNGSTVNSGDGGPALAAGLAPVVSLALDPYGGLYLASAATSVESTVVRKIDPATGTITTLAQLGGWYRWYGWYGYGPPVQMTFDGSALLLANSYGIYRVDVFTGSWTMLGALGTIRGVAPTGSSSTAYATVGNQIYYVYSSSPYYYSGSYPIYGSSSAGFSGDNGPAWSAQFNTPTRLSYAAPYLYVYDAGNARLRRINTSTGVITTHAGTGSTGFCGDGEIATNAPVMKPMDLASSAAGDLVIMQEQAAPRFVDARTGVLSTVTSESTYASDRDGVAVSADGRYVYVSERWAHQVRRIDRLTGLSSVVAGNGEAGFSGDGGNATAARLNVPGPLAIAPNGDLYVADVGNRRIRKVAAGTNIISTVVGSGVSGYFGDGGPAVYAAIGHVEGLAFDAAGNLYVSDAENNRVRKVDTAGIITTIAGIGYGLDAIHTQLGNGGPATQAVLAYPMGLAVTANGDVYVADLVARQVRRIVKATGIIEAAVGTGQAGLSGDGGPAKAATMRAPVGLALGPGGVIYVSDADNNRVRVFMPLPDQPAPPPTTTPPTTTPPVSTTPTTQPPPGTGAGAGGADLFVGVTPVRLVDTRTGLGAPRAKLSARSVMSFAVAGLAGVPSSGAVAASLNVTATNPEAAGYLTVFPCGSIPNASNLNYVAGQTVANAVVAPLSADGRVCVTTFATTDVVVDLSGWFRANAGFAGMSPVRILDTRIGVGAPAAQLAGGTMLTLRVAGLHGVDPAATAVSLNVTATQERGDGYLTVFPCGTPPNASHVNYRAGQTVPNAVISPLSADGRLCVFSYATADVIVDLNGYFETGSGFNGLTPARIVDTRDGTGAARAKLLPGTVLTVRPPVPAGAVAASFNVTATNPEGDGYLTVFPCGDVPNASNVNYTRGGTVPNEVIAPLSADGRACIVTYAPTDVIVDLNGWFGRAAS